MADEAADKMTDMSLGEIYTSEKSGSDETGDGTQDKPFKTALQAMRKAGKEPFPTIYVDSKEDGQGENGKVFGSPGADLTSCLQALDEHLSQSSYIVGHVPTKADTVVHDCIGRASASMNGPVLPSHPHFMRWWRHIESFGSNSKDFPQTDLCILLHFNLPHGKAPQVNIRKFA